MLPFSRAILQGLRQSGIPSINFATGNPALLSRLTQAGGDVIGLDWRIEIDDAWSIIGPAMGVQGNLDPASLLAGSEVAISRADVILRKVRGRPGHIFNVGHGILPETDPQVIRAVVEHVHSVDLSALRGEADEAVSAQA